jgi:hypothetical protein
VSAEKALICYIQIQYNHTLHFNVQGFCNYFINFFAQDIPVLPSSRNVPAAPLVVFFVINSYKYNGALHLQQSHRVAKSL